MIIPLQLNFLPVKLSYTPWRDLWKSVCYHWSKFLQTEEVSNEKLPSCSSGSLGIWIFFLFIKSKAREREKKEKAGHRISYHFQKENTVDISIKRCRDINRSVCIALLLYFLLTGREKIPNWKSCQKISAKKIF